MHKTFVFLHRGVSVLYVVTFIALQLLNRWRRDRDTPVKVVNNLHPWLFIPAHVFLFTSLSIRDWSTSLGNFVLVFAFIWNYGRRFFCKRHQRSIANLSVMTFNLGAQKHELRSMINVIATSNADIVALQELSTHAENVISLHLLQQYPFQALQSYYDHPTAGLGILSRHPILASESVQWTVPCSKFLFGRQAAIIMVKGRTLSVHNFHLPNPVITGVQYDDSERTRHLSLSLHSLSREVIPQILLGDFNLCERSQDYAHIAVRYRDVFQSVGQGLGLTYPRYIPLNIISNRLKSVCVLPRLMRLDYIFVSTGIEAVRAWVGSNCAGSDHSPVFAHLNINT